MKSSLNYKGYDAVVEFCAEDKIFHGQVSGLSDIITFEGESVEKLLEDFHNAVDEYLAVCADIGREPEKPYSGVVTLVLPPDIRSAAEVAAQKNGQSLSAWAAETFKKQLQPSQ